MNLYLKHSLLLILGLAASNLLVGCKTYPVQVSDQSITEYESRWDGLEASKGAPDPSFKALYGDVLKELIYTRGELEKEKD